MNTRKDILFNNVDDRYDLEIRNGDFVIGNSDIQNIRHIVEADQGQFKQWPKIGVAIRRYLDGNNIGEMKRKALIHLKADGYTPRKVNQVDNGIVIKL